LVSFLWAQTPKLVLQRSVATFGATLLGVALAVKLPIDSQLRLISWVTRIIAGLSFACVILVPHYGISVWPHEGDWRGIFGHKNSLGATMALSVLVEWHLPADTLFQKALKLLAVLLSSVLLFFSNSITSMVTLLGALMFIQIYKLARHWLRLPLVAIFAAGFGALFTSVIILVFAGDIITGAMGRSMDLTGRTTIWRWVISYILDKPLLGYGYSGFWGGASQESLDLDRHLGQGSLMYSHNGYLDLCLTLGIVGFFLGMFFLAVGLKRAYEACEHNESLVDQWPLAFLFFVLLHNVAECTILMQSLEWSLCVSTIIAADHGLFADHPETEESLIFAPSQEFS
jgi:exopolysaccharide production protein ExoQ